MQGFRLDVPGPEITEDALADLLVRHLGLLMVDQVRLRAVAVFAEPHRGSRGGPADRPAAPATGRLVELNHVIRAGMVTYPGLNSRPAGERIDIDADGNVVGLFWSIRLCLWRDRRWPTCWGWPHGLAVPRIRGEPISAAIERHQRVLAPVAGR